MSSTAPTHTQSMNSDDDSEFYKMLELRLSYFLKHGEDHPDYVANLDGDVHQQQSLPAPDVAAQVDSTNLLTEDWNNLPPSILNARTPVGAEQEYAADEITLDTHLYLAPPVVNLEGHQYNLSSVDSSNERSPANASGVTQGHVDPTKTTKSQRNSQITRGKSGGNGSVETALEGKVRDSPTGHGIQLYRAGDWWPAIRHANIRDALLQEADHMAKQYGGYDFPPAQGLDPTDRTAFVQEHKTWGPDRRHRPEINFIFEKPKTPLPVNVQPNTRPREWVWHGMIVLDHKDKPMRDFQDCPTTLASCVEGFRIDAILKRNSHMETLDLWGRLPPCHTAWRTDMSTKVVPIVTIAGLNNVAMRWRFEAGVLSFIRRKGADDTKEFLTQFLTPQQLAANTTRGGRDLTKAEVLELLEYKKAADSARKKGEAPPALARRVDVVEAPPVVSSPSAMNNQAAGPVGPLISHADPIGKILNDSVDQVRESATGLLVDQVETRGQKRQLEKAIETGDPPEDSRDTPKARTMSEYRPVLPLKHSRRAISSLETPANEDFATAYLSPGQQYHQAGAKSLTNSPSLCTAEGPPTKKRRGKSMFNDAITQHEWQNQHIGLAQGRRPDFNDSRPVSSPRHEYAYLNCPDPPPKNRKTVPPGFRHVLYPIGLAITLFCPDDTVVRQGIIKSGEKTVWHDQKIPDMIQTLQAMHPSHKLSRSVPSEVFRKVHVISSKSIPTESYSYDVPEGFEPLNYPIGKKVVCVYPGTEEIFGGVIAADGHTLWQRLSVATTIALLEDMKTRWDSLQQEIAEFLGATCPKTVDEP